MPPNVALLGRTRAQVVEDVARDVEVSSSPRGRASAARRLPAFMAGVITLTDLERRIPPSARKLEFALGAAALCADQAQIRRRSAPRCRRLGSQVTCHMVPTEPATRPCRTNPKALGSEPPGDGGRALLAAGWPICTCSLRGWTT